MQVALLDLRRGAGGRIKKTPAIEGATSGGVDVRRAMIAGVSLSIPIRKIRFQQL